ncbi:hypothetical protein F5B19DRAFT_458505 [Rostrohypoxylon terebratum]|nr:hypothetical protein F5B19DRAFT_458505 [Rostrohypoxylon terebratum]
MDFKALHCDDRVGAEGDVALDHQARLAQLRQIVLGSPLTKEEHRYLKILLAGASTDIIGELPVELVKQIADLLDLRDFVTCLAVSRRWREKFLSAPIINAITDEECPSLRQIPTDNPLDSNQCLKVLHRIGRMRHLCCESYFEKSFSWQDESYFKLDPEYHGHHEDVSTAYAQFDCHSDQEPDFPPNQQDYQPLYCNGRIAWRPWARIIAVDNLWSRTRKIFTPPNGPLVHPECELRALGDKLVIVSMDRLLIAWDYTTNIRQEKKLPGPVTRVVTKGYQAAVILFSGEVFLWEFGGKLLTLPTTPLVNSHGFTNELIKYWNANLCVVFHPTCNGKLFLASGYTDCSSSKPVVKRVVYEFTDTNHTDTFEFEAPRMNPSNWEPPKALFQTGRGMPYHRDIITFREAYLLEDDDSRTIAFETLVEFDIYKRKFRVRYDKAFAYHRLGWASQHTSGDMDFLVRFYDRHFIVDSFQPGFDFKIGE